MSMVLGVSMGASAVRIARPEALAPAHFEYRVVHALRGAVEQLAAESIGVLVAQSGPDDEVSATAVAYRDDQQAGAIEQAMARQQLHNYQLVPEMQATLQALRQSGELLDYSTVAFYDLGSSGLTVSVVDVVTEHVIATDRTEDIGGNKIDVLIRDNQMSRMSMAPDSVDARQFVTRCRVAKEQLSTSGAVALPGDGGLILLSREALDSIITVSVDNSIRFVREVLSRSPQRVQALVMIGGGSRIPLVQTRVGHALGLPSVMPSEPESLSAKGAAMLAVPTESSRMTTEPILRGVVDAPQASRDSGARESGSAAPGRGTLNGGARNGNAPASGSSAFGGPPPRSTEPSWNTGNSNNHDDENESTTRRRTVRGAALAAVGLGVVAAIGISLGAGGSDAPSVPVSTPVPQATTPVAPRTTTAAPTTTLAPTTVPPVTAAPAATVPPAATTERRTQSPARVQPAPAPAPPALVIPGLPPIPLPVLPVLPPLPRLPGL